MSDVVDVALITVIGSTVVTIGALTIAAWQARTLDLKKQKRHFDATRQRDDLTELRQLCDEALKTMNSVELDFRDLRRRRALMVTGRS